MNPCAMYVLAVLLGLLLHAGSRVPVVLCGGTFVAISGIVYLLFRARALKAVPGALLLALGTVFVVAPGLLE